MYETLYRKYRPQKFSEVTGQPVAKTILQNEVATEKISHAYLFSGPRGVGKTSVARILAKAANCLKRQDGDSEPCGDCALCASITEGKCFDVLEIDAASHTGVDNVRDNIIENTRFSPSAGKFKVFIIDEVHMLSKGAFNALLKTLEEAPAHAIFILATTEIHKVPETVISRCEHFAFKKIGDAELVERLTRLAKEENIKLDTDAAWQIAHAARGSLRDAESLLGQLLSVAGDDGQITAKEAELVIPKSNRQATREFYELLANRDAPELLRLVNRLVEEGIDIEKFYDDCIDAGRELILRAVSGEDSSPVGVAKKIGTDNFINFLEKLIEKKTLMKFAPLPQIALELAVMEFCNNRSGLTLINTPHQNPPIGGVGTGQARIDAEEKFANPPATDNTALIKSGSDIEREVLNNPVNLAEIKSRWNEFLERLPENNPSLSLVLRLSEPRELVGNKLKISVAYRFHREKLNDFKTRQLVDKCLLQTFGAPLSVEAEVGQKLIVEKSGQDNLLTSVLREFGGRVME